MRISVLRESKQMLTKDQKTKKKVTQNIAEKRKYYLIKCTLYGLMLESKIALIK